MSEFTVTTKHQGMRLDKFLTEKLPGHSRSQIQKMIKTGQVMINYEKISVHHFLKIGDKIDIKNNNRANPFQGALASKSTRPSNGVAEASMPRLDIIEDNKHFLIVNKPVGLVVHEATGYNGPTLVDQILKKYPDITKIGEDPMRPGIVHRLDKEVSGLMVIAKTQDMFDHLKSQFKTRKIKKEYIALVYGSPQKLEGEIEFKIDRAVNGYKMAALPKSANQRGRFAITEFEVLEKLGNYTLLKIKTQTGRTHQIRVHLNAYGLPVVGDSIYKPKKLKVKIKLGRIFLQANCLGFYDLDNNWQEFSIPLASELQSTLGKLHKS